MILHGGVFLFLFFVVDSRRRLLHNLFLLELNLLLSLTIIGSRRRAGLHLIARRGGILLLHGFVGAEARQLAARSEAEEKEEREADLEDAEDDADRVEEPEDRSVADARAYRSTNGNEAKDALIQVWGQPHGKDEKGDPFWELG